MAEKLKNIFENHDKVSLAYNKLVDVIVWEDNNFMMKYSIKEVQDFIKKYIEKNAEKDILSFVNAIRDFKNGLYLEEPKEDSVDIGRKMTFRQEILDAIAQKFSFSENELAHIKKYMKNKFVEFGGKKFVFKVVDDCDVPPTLSSTNDSDMFLGDAYLPALERFLDYNEFNVFYEEHKGNDYYIHINLED